MRYLGIDYGSKRVGVAVSDESAKFALPLAVIANTENLLLEVERLAKENDTRKIVIGESRKYDMSANKILPEIMDFKDRLDKRGYKTYLELEFMTSEQAERLQGKHDKIDASAAALILQSFLDKQSS
ncbi:MAG: RuvX/YqgF family protein [Candidatus Taylorbacteria bacterium]|nr:RuvX/YqgF family protein [Candidatus Taylorbacteria bacterium]